MIKIFGFEINQAGEKISQEIIAFLSQNDIQVYDLSICEPEVTDTDIILVFGTKASKQLTGLKSKTRLDFPDFIKLDAAFGEEAERQLAKNQLLSLKKAIDSDKTNTNKQYTENRVEQKIREDLPDLSTSEIIGHFKAILKKQGIKEWIGTTKSGKVIRLTLEKENDSANTITFAEAYALRLAMETLNVEEFEIVYSNNQLDINQQNSPNGRSSNSNERRN